MSLVSARIVKASDTKAGTGPILYWMDRDMRLADNWALLYAQELAHTRGVPLFIAYNAVPGFLGGGLRQWHFKIGALTELCADAAKYNIPFFVLTDDSGSDTPELIASFVNEHGIGTVVTDFSPLRIQRNWKDAVAARIPCPLIEVDAHNIVPVHVASQKKEFAAYTIRPKLHRLLPEYLTEFPALKTQEPTLTAPEPSWETLLAHPAIDTDVAPISWALPGERATHAALERFIAERLPRYATERNDPLAEAQSDLSPYLHYGMLSAQRIALRVLSATDSRIEDALDSVKNKAKLDTETPELIDHVGAFLEELIVRRELSDNFCLYEPAYDTPEGFPEWARRSHDAHRGDERETVYTREEFELGKTHDDLWNAAQREMVMGGKMHGYMRMYWAKKILEWTRSPEEAMEIAIYLNDKYEIDGRDPNGYAGIAWSIGGVHDRAWFVRPVFGQIRYMARSGCEKRFEVPAYIRAHS
jgi:deoxyribodipyrimidine photo-lyase